MRLALTPQSSTVLNLLAPRLFAWRWRSREAFAPKPTEARPVSLASRVQAALQAAARARR